MDSYESAAHKEGDKRGGYSYTPSNRDHVAYKSANEEMFGPDGADVRGRIVVHPLFEHLLAAHVSCLTVGAPEEKQHSIESALANRHHVTAKYLTLLSYLQSSSLPAENEELTHFMVDYILLLKSFKDQLHHHLSTQASEAISACQQIEQALFNLTGVSSSSYTSNMTQSENQYSGHGNSFDQHGLRHLGIKAFLPYHMQRSLREHVRRELKQELKKDYQSKLKDVRDEILRKRRAAKLPEDTTHHLRDWWLSHGKWPHPTEEEMSQMMEETGLDLKQINNWFINQRKRAWQAKINEGENHEENAMKIISNPINVTSSSSIDK